MTAVTMLLLLMSVPVFCQLPSSNWRIDSNGSSVWEGYGLARRWGACSWSLRDQSHNIEVNLFEDAAYSRYLRVTVFLNYSVNRAYPFYDGIAHAEYQLHAKDQYFPEVKDFDIMPKIYLFNGTLEISEGGDVLMVELSEEEVSEWLLAISMAHLTVKLLLLGAMVRTFREVNNKLSFALVYVIIGWELQAHLTVIKIFQATKDEAMMGIGVFIGLLGWGVSLATLLLLPRPFVGWESIEGLIYYGYTCSSGLFFTQSGNVMLYALSPLLQVRFNVLQNIKNSICPFAFSIYLINIFFIYYVKGCPACTLRYPLDLPLCFKATAVAVVLGVMLWMQGRKGPLLCLREAIQGKDYKYLVEINLSEGEEMMEEVCAICLQPLATQALVQNFRDAEGTRKGSIMQTPCNHKYHAACLRTWLLEKNTCPMDNQLIPPCFQ